MLRYISDYLGCAETGRGTYDDPLDVGIALARTLYEEGEGWRDRLDEEGRLRLDQHELEPKLQSAIAELWRNQQPGPPDEITLVGFARFKRDYAQLYGWEVDGVDYEMPYTVDPPLSPDRDIFDLLASSD
jgi:trans-2-enoyl-CoA reductase